MLRQFATKVVEKPFERASMARARFRRWIVPLLATSIMRSRLSIGSSSCTLFGWLSRRGFRRAKISGSVVPFLRARHPTGPRFAHQADGLHVTSHCGIGLQWSQRRISFCQGGDVVIVPLVAPVLVVVVLVKEMLGQHRIRDTLPQSLRMGRRKALTGSFFSRRAV